jgi:uncharacterized protein (DUF1778 family)
MKTHTTLDLDRDLLEQAAEALGTTRTTDTVHAALRDVIARTRRTRLVQRDFSNLGDLLPEMRAPRFPIDTMPAAEDGAEEPRGADPSGHHAR